MSRRYGPPRERHLALVEPEPTRELRPTPQAAAASTAVDTDPPKLEPERFLRHQTFDDETLVFAARFGIELRFDPFPCRGFACCCDCFRCQRREEWSRMLHEHLVAAGTSEPRATALAATKAAEYAARLLRAPDRLGPAPIEKTP